MTLTFSNSPLWTACAQSVSPLPGTAWPFERTDAQMEGEAAHWLANMVLRGDAATAADGAGETAPNGWPIDELMVQHVQTYIDTVSRHGPVVPEQDLTVFGGLVRGRPDPHPVDDGDVLRIYELKYGWKIVEPHGNPQLLLAAVALVKPHHRLISLEVFQPRPSHPAGAHRKWTLNQDELKTWEGWLIDRASATQAPQPVATAGPQCGICPRRAVCHGLALNVYAQFETIQTSRRAMPLTAAQIAAELTFLETAAELLKARRSGIVAEAEARIRNNEFIPGWGLFPRLGNRVFLVSAAMIKMLTGCDPFKQVPKSPAELEKEGANRDVVAQISHRPHAGMELKPWDPKAIERAFK